MKLKKCGEICTHKKVAKRFAKNYLANAYTARNHQLAKRVSGCLHLNAVQRYKGLKVIVAAIANQKTFIGCAVGWRNIRKQNLEKIILSYESN